MEFQIRLEIRRDWFMNKKEANEIKKLFTPAAAPSPVSAAAMWNAEKNKKTELKEHSSLSRRKKAF